MNSVQVNLSVLLDSRSVIESGANSQNPVVELSAEIINIVECPEGLMLELTQGQLFVVPSPSVKHQIISQRLNNIVYNFVTDNSLGVVLTTPVDFKLSDENVVIPDILFDLFT